MTKRILIAGLFGGVALFAWEAVAHMVTPLGDTGIQPLANEDAWISMIQQSVKEPGFYFFPAPDWKAGMNNSQKQQAMQAAMDKAGRGPSGILIATPSPTKSLTPGQFGTQFAGDVLIMLVVAFLLAHTSATFGRRVVLAGLAGLIPTLAVEIPYWNWYKFPMDYVAAQFVVHVVGFLAGGLAIARLLKGAPERAGAAAA